MCSRRVPLAVCPPSLSLCKHHTIVDCTPFACLIHPPPPASGNTGLFFVSQRLFFYLFARCDFFKTPRAREIMLCLSFSDLLPLRGPLLVYPCCHRWEKLIFSWAERVPPHVCTAAALSICPLVDTEAVSVSCPRRKLLQERRCPRPVGSSLFWVVQRISSCLCRDPPHRCPQRLHAFTFPQQGLGVPFSPHPNLLIAF